ncbi:MAG: hypothetical protein WAV73_04385 [Candidatus Moraniibacteriota bacterium]
MTKKTKPFGDIFLAEELDDLLRLNYRDAKMGLSQEQKDRLWKCVVEFKSLRELCKKKDSQSCFCRTTDCYFMRMSQWLNIVGYHSLCDFLTFTESLLQAKYLEWNDPPNARFPYIQGGLVSSR